MAEELETTFSDLEIMSALKGLDKNKFPGLDGFNGYYINLLWEFIKEHVYRFHQNFHETGRLPPGMNSSFIALIPKILSSKSVDDYRPISLINCTLKILLKLVATRLNKVMRMIISETQFRFIRGRSIYE